MLLLLVMMPTIMFSEVVFMPRLGFDIHKGIKNQLLDGILKEVINTAINSDKKEGEEPSYLSNDQLPHSKPLISMFTIGLDMQFIHHGSGFTFFFNNEFSYASNFKAYEQFRYGDSKILPKEVGTLTEKQKIMLYSFELLMGGTFRREQAFNIHFGIGLKVGLTPNSISTVIKAFKDGRNAVPDQVTMMVVPAFGGTFGFTYYFNEIVGLSVSINEFLGFGGFLSTRVTEKENNKLKSAVAYASMGFTNNFAMKFGVNLRIHGVRGSEL